MIFPSRLLPKIQQLVSFYKSHDIDADDLRAARSRAAHDFIAARARIYLDTNWWVRLRNARFSATPHPAHRQILDSLSDLVSTGKAVALPSGVCIEEVLRQHDLHSRLATASVMDMLSCGIALTGKTQQAIYEMSFWISEHFPGVSPVAPPGHSVMTAPAYTILTPSITARGGPPGAARLQPLVIDHLCAEMTFSEVMLQWEDWREDNEENSARASSMNDGRITKKARSQYNDVYLDEAMGYWRTYWPKLCHAVSGSKSDNYDGLSIADTESALRECLSMGSSKAPPAALQIIAACHATMRTEKTRKFKPGDWHDLNHAAMALPYCTAFFTERSLHHMLTTAPAQLARDRDCLVFSQEPNILEYLASL